MKKQISEQELYYQTKRLRKESRKSFWKGFRNFLGELSRTPGCGCNSCLNYKYCWRDKIYGL